MRKLIMKMSMSLDGFVSDLNGGNEWIFKTGDQESKTWSAGIFRDAGLIIMGRKSFESMSTYWPTAAGPFAAPMNEIPKAVFTKKGFAVKHAGTYNAARGIAQNAGASAAELSWGDAQVFDGDLAEEIKKLKAGPGKRIIALGGAGFMRSLIETGLIDEYQLPIHPVALGSGLPIFSGLATPLYLKLVDTKVFPGGTVAFTYRPA
jgi:dihydrofolate reductase